jgi:transcriptional regulator GlxA family with amidase domain
MDRVTFLRVFYYFLALVVPPLIFGAVVIYKSISDISFTDPKPFDISKLESPMFDKNKLTALIVVGNKGTEITDFLAPYEILSQTAEFNVFTVAPERTISPLNGGIDFIPHYSLEQIDDLMDSRPHLIVVPNIPNIQSPEDKVIIEWLRQKDDGKTVFLSVCEGARTLAAAGLLNSRKATTHWSAIGHLQGQYPGTQWLSGYRYVEDGNIITSPGVVTGSMDGTLYVVEKLIGKQEAEEAAQAIGYKHYGASEFSSVKISLPDSVWLLTALYPWSKDEIGVYIKEGVEEIELASILDVYPRSFTAVTYTFSNERDIIKSKNGLDFVPKYNFKNIGYLDRLLVLGDELDQQELNFFTKYYKKLKVETPDEIGSRENRFAYDKTLLDLAMKENRAIAKTVSKTLEYPAGHLDLKGAGWPFGLLLGPLLIGIGGVIFARWFEKRYLT